MFFELITGRRSRGSPRSRRIHQVMLGPVRTLFRTIVHVARDLVALISLAMRSRAQLAAENLFLRKQLALYLERKVKPRRASDATRLTLVLLPKLFRWREVLTIREAGHLHPVAPRRLLPVLEMEIEVPRTATGSCRASETGRPEC